MILYVIVIEYSNDQYDLVNLKFHASSSTFVKPRGFKNKGKEDKWLWRDLPLYFTQLTFDYP